MPEPMRTSGRAAQRAEWDRRRDKLHHLYIVENKSLQDVMSIMKEHHHFNKTKDQYTTTFRRWKFRKNGKATEWRSMAPQILQQSAVEKCINIQFVGTASRISKTKALRAAHRYGYQTVLEKLIPAKNVNHQPAQLSLRLSAPHTNNKLYHLIIDLFWPRFVVYLRDQVLLNIQRLGIHLPDIDLPPESWKSAMTMLSSNFPCSKMSMISIMACNRLGGDSTWSASELYNIWLDTREFLPETPTADISIIQDSTSELAKRIFLLELLELSVYILSNDMDSAKTVGAQIVELCKNQVYQDFLRRLLRNKQPTVSAMAEKLLISAVEAEDETMVKLLLDAKTNPNARLRFQSPLHTAIAHKHTRLVRLLVENGANINLIEYIRHPFWPGLMSPLTHAILLIRTRTDIELVRDLLDRGAKIKSDNKFRSANPLCCAIDHLNHSSHGSPDAETVLDLVSLLLKYRPDFYYSRNTSSAMKLAVKTGSIKLVQTLMQHDDIAWPKNKGIERSLTCAAISGTRDLVELLISKGALINATESAVIEVTKPRGFILHPGTALAVAIQGNNEAIVKLLISHGADTRDLYTGGTALGMCARHGHASLLKYFLERGEDPSPGNLMHFAAEGGDLNCVEMLLKAGTPVDELNEEGETPILVAAKKGSIDIVAALITGGANVNIPTANELDYWDSSPLTAALGLEDPEIARLLLQSGADVNNPLKSSLAPSPLECSVIRCRYNFYNRLDPYSRDLFPDLDIRMMMEHLVELGAQVDDSGALLAAVEMQDMTAIHFLVEKNRECLQSRSLPDDYGRAALVEAILQQENELVYMFNDVGVDPIHHPLQKLRPESMNAIAAAVLTMNTELIRWLQMRGSDIDKAMIHTGRGREYCSPLALLDTNHESAIEIAQLLINSDVRVDDYANRRSYYDPQSRRKRPHFIPSEGFTVLQSASNDGKLELVRYLISAGADVNMPAHYSSGRTALQAASEEGHIAVIDLLLQSNADVNASPATVEGGTALQLAAGGGHLKVVRLLLEAGAHVNNPRGKIDGRSAVEIAAENGRLDITKLVLDNGADICGVHNEQYCRAIHFATSGGHMALAALLRQYNASGCMDLNCESCKRIIREIEDDEIHEFGTEDNRFDEQRSDVETEDEMDDELLDQEDEVDGADIESTNFQLSEPLGQTTTREEVEANQWDSWHEEFHHMDDRSPNTSFGLREFDPLTQMGPESMSTEPQGFSSLRPTNTPTRRVFQEVHNGDVFMGHSGDCEENYLWLEMEDLQEQFM